MTGDRQWPISGRTSGGGITVSSPQSAELHIPGILWGLFPFFPFMLWSSFTQEVSDTVALIPSVTAGNSTTNATRSPCYYSDKTEIMRVLVPKH